MPRGIPNKPKEPEQPQEVKPVDQKDMTDREYFDLMSARAADASLIAEERLFAMREVGRLRANGLN